MHLPAEIVEGILLNLPLKSLFRFSSVSKTWNSMISDSGFPQKYNMRGGVVRIALIGKRDTRLYDVHKQRRRSSELVVCPFSTRPEFLAFCEHLWLVKSKSSLHLYLWNPSMRSYKKLSKPPSNSSSGYAYGVGYASDADDYKIVRIGHRTHLYSRRSDSWRRIPSPSRTVRRRGGAPVSGHLHWVSRSSNRSIIVAFDLCTDAFREVALPNTSRLVRPYSVRLSVLGGKLCATLAHDGHTGGGSDVWVMEDYGVARSWTKKFTCAFMHQVQPLYLYPNGEILMIVGRSLYLGRRRLRSLRRRIPSESFFNGFLYAHTFVQP